MRLEFGIFDHLDDNGIPLAELFETRLKLTEQYDRAGIRSYHIAEHHSTPLGIAPSPSVFLAAVAQRTKRLRFGPLLRCGVAKTEAFFGRSADMIRNAKMGKTSHGRETQPKWPSENPGRFQLPLQL
jgi:Luciferase-like monooxygenase